MATKINAKVKIAGMEFRPFSDIRTPGVIYSGAHA